MLARFLDRRAFAWMAAAAAGALFVALGALRGATGELTGDEPTFVAMAASLARDGDLRFEESDADWARSRPGRPAGLILQQTALGVTYSKPILMPLVAAPFYALAEERGLLLFQLLALGGALALARAALARRAGGARATETLLCFGFASIVVPHLAWRTTETLQVALALAGLALTLGGELPGDGSSAAARSPGGWLRGRAATVAGAVCLGLLVALREPNALVACVPIGAAVLARRWRRALAIALVAAGSYTAVISATSALTGARNPYKALRSTFDGATGYPAGPDGGAALARFTVESNLATSDLGAVPRLDLGRSAYAALYFAVGRHSGLVAYFPAALALVWAAARRPRAGDRRARLDRVGRVALAGFAASALFFLVWWPENYFGGSTHLGNRYLLAAYPCLLFVPRVLPSRRALAAAWLVAFGFGVSALASVTRPEALEMESQGTSSHAHAGLFRLLPYESVASAIDGRRDRYWAGDFLRFVDPFARASASSFELAAGAPAAEVEIATAWRGAPLRFLAIADRPRAALEVCDWLDSERIELAPDGSGRAGGIVELHPSPAWRVHHFWWPSDRPYRARMLRFRLDAEPEATLRLRYLGRARIPESGFGRELVRLELPPEARAGTRGRIDVVVRNTGSWRWSSEESLPVLIGARLAGPDGASREFRAPFDFPVDPDETATVRLSVDWPRAPGDYRLTVDLVLEDVAWFAERVGAPLGEATVGVRP